MGPDGKLFWATYQAIRRQFGQVYVIGLEPGGRVPSTNIVLFATVSADPIDSDQLRRNAEALESRWKLPGLGSQAAAMTHSPQPPDGIPELTDAYAPVEALQHF